MPEGGQHDVDFTIFLDSKMTKINKLVLQLQSLS